MKFKSSTSFLLFASHNTGYLLSLLKEKVIWVKSTFAIIFIVVALLFIALPILPVKAFGNGNDLTVLGPGKETSLSLATKISPEEAGINSSKTTHHFLAGVKLGAVFVFGVELNYILKHMGRKVMYIGAAGQTSIVINSINGGGGFFLNNWGLGVGCRYHHVIRLYDENISLGIPGYSPEIVWYREMGLNRNWYINLRAATIITKEDFWPDVSFGIFLPLNR